MKITYLHQYFNTPSMQGGTRSFEMARRLVAWGHEVTMVTSWREPTEEDSWFVTEEEGIEVHWLPIEYANEMSYSQRMNAFMRFALGSAKRAASLAADVVFATSTPLTIALPAVYASRRQNCPFVLEVRDLWPEMPIAIGALQNPVLVAAAKWLERFAYRNAKKIVALSPGIADGIRQAGVDSEFITVIPNGCDLDVFNSDRDAAREFLAERPMLRAGPIVLYAGALGRINGVDYMVRVAAKSLDLDPTISFVVLGAGSELRAVRDLALELGVLDKNFFLYPWLSKDEIGSAFTAAAVVTSWVVDLPEAEKNCANKFFDALAAGRPVCLNYRGWQADLLEAHGAGFTIPRDHSEAAMILVNKVQDKEFLQNASASARNLAETQFARDFLAEDLEKTLIHVVEADYAEQAAG